MIYDKAYFIAKFAAIPDSEIGECGLRNQCGLWHCGVRKEDDLNDLGLYVHTEESLALISLFSLLKPKLSGLAAAFWCVNDGNDSRYSQTSARARIIAALHDLP